MYRAFLHQGLARLLEAASRPLPRRQLRLRGRVSLVLALQLAGGLRPCLRLLDQRLNGLQGRLLLPLRPAAEHHPRKPCPQLVHRRLASQPHRRVLIRDLARPQKKRRIKVRMQDPTRTRLERVKRTSLQLPVEPRLRPKMKTKKRTITRSRTLPLLLRLPRTLRNLHKARDRGGPLRLQPRRYILSARSAARRLLIDKSRTLKRNCDFWNESGKKIES